MRSLAHTLLNIVLPQRCVGCQRYDAVLCGECVLQHRAADANSRLDPAHNAGVFSITRLGAYADPFWRNVIAQFKFHGAREIGDLLGCELADLYSAHHTNAVPTAQTIVVPIPLHPRRERERGFNQSALLARAFSAHAGIPIASVLQRVRYTDSQTQQEHAARFDNMRDAFTLHALNSTAEQSSPLSIILIDDVVTTGATVLSAASALAPLRPVAIHVCAIATAW